MRRVLGLLLLALACSIGAAARAEQAVPLKIAGVLLDFVRWSEQAPGFTYADLAISRERLAEHQAQGHPFIERLYRSEVHLAVDGSITERQTQSRVYLSQSGVQSYGNMDFWVDAATQIATIEQAYTLLPDGRRVEVEPETIQAIVDSQDDVFTDSYNVIVPYSALEPGAVSVLVVTIRETGGARVSPWSMNYYPQILVPVGEFDVHLTWEEGAPPLQWRSDYGAIGCVRHGARDVRCRASDLPAFLTDPNGRFADALPSLIVAEASTWGEFADRMRRIVDASRQGNDGVQDILDRILAGADDDIERLDRIHRFVSREIRYVGLEQGAGGIVPRPPEQTLQRRFGDCKDKTTLFVELAQRAGLQAFPVLTSTERTDPAKLLVPASSYFDHMVACVRLDSGREYCVDLTDSYSSYDTLSYFVQGAIRFDLVENAGNPGRLPVLDFFWNKTVEVLYRLLADGSVEAQQTATYAGQHAAELRSILQSMTRVERERWALDRYHETVSKRADPTFEFAGIDEVGAPLVIKATVLHASIFDPTTLDIYVDYESELGMAPTLLAADNKAYEYVFPGIRYHGELIFELPEGHAAAYTGPRLNLETPYGTLQRSYSAAGREVRVSTDLTMHRTNVPVGEIPQFNRFVDFISDNQRVWFATRGAAEPSSAALQ